MLEAQDFYKEEAETIRRVYERVCRDGGLEGKNSVNGIESYFVDFCKKIVGRAIDEERELGLKDDLRKRKESLQTVCQQSFSSWREWARQNLGEQRQEPMLGTSLKSVFQGTPAKKLDLDSSGASDPHTRGAGAGSSF